MTKGKLHEQAFNYALAEVLRAQHADWSTEGRVIAERSDLVTDHKKYRPDILIDSPGLPPVCVEVEVDGTQKAHPEGDAEQRLDLNLKGGETIRTAIAVRAPEEVRKYTENKPLKEWLKNGCRLLFACLYRRNGQSKLIRWPEKGYLEGGVSDLADLILSSTVPGEIGQLAECAADELKDTGATLLKASPPATIEGVCDRLKQRDQLQGFSVAACVWLNALLLQERIRVSQTVKGLKGIQGLLKTSNVTPGTLRKEWRKIQAVNYHSIYRPAMECLEKDFGTEALSRALTRLVNLAEKIIITRIGQTVDVGAAIFPLLSADRKTAAAFYTKAEAAELLAGMCLPPPARTNGQAGSCILGKRLNDPKELKALRIADPACGTGTLLRAVYRRIRTQYEQATNTPFDLHAEFMGSVLRGIDITPIAAHLTAASLSSIGEAKPYKSTNIGVVSVRDGETGSLSLLDKGYLADMFKSQVQSSSGEKDAPPQLSLRDGSLNLVIMNPPYSRTRGGQSAFDVEGLTESERMRSQGNLKKLYRGTSANMSAGMGSGFIALAHKKLMPGGTLGSVLPLTAAMQKSWTDFRRLIEEEYQNVIVVTLSSDKQGSFSADTGMGEMLLVGQKQETESAGVTENRRKDPHDDLFMVNLERPPLHMAEAAEMAKAIHKARDSRNREGELLQEGRLMLGDQVQIGQWVRKASTHTGAAWSGVGTRNRALSLVTDRLEQGFLRGLEGGKETKLPLRMVPLGELFTMGPTHDLIGHLVGRDQRGAFEFNYARKGAAHSSMNPALWAAKCEEQRQILVRETHEGYGYATPDKKEKMLEKRSDLFVARNLRWTSQALVAASTKRPMMGGRAWTALLHEEQPVKDAFALWANSTFGMLLYWARGGRQQAGRSMMQVRALGELPVPDFAATGEHARRARTIAEMFTECSTQTMLPGCLAWKDPSRVKLDEIVCRMLGLSQEDEKIIGTLREAWCREPSVHGNSKKAMAAWDAEK